MHRAGTELTLHLGRDDSRDTCRTLDFLQDRQTNRGCLLTYEATALQLRGNIRPDSILTDWLKWLKKRSTAQLQGHIQISLCFHVRTRQKVVPYWSSTQRCHKSYKRPSGRIFCHHYCENECSAKMNVGPHRMGLKRTAGHARALKASM